MFFVKKVFFLFDLNKKSRFNLSVKSRNAHNIVNNFIRGSPHRE